MTKTKTDFQLALKNKWHKFLHSDVRQSTTKKILATIVAIFISFMLAMIIANSVCGTWKNFGKVLNKIFTSGFETKSAVNTLVSNMAILIVGGMAFIFAYKAGLFNIGISGQMVAGATGATIVCHMAHIPTGGNQVVIVIVSMGIGALMAAIVGALKAYLRINEVVSSIMFNWIIYFMSILTLGSLAIPRDASNLNTLAPADNLLLRMNGNSWLPLLILAIITIGFVAIVLNYTVFGRKQRVTGLSNTGALAAGYNVKANQIASMAISGAISGLLGVMLYCGFSPNMPVTAAAKAIPQEGFNGISVGLISMCNPIASVPVSLFFSMVKTSASELQILGIDNHIADVVFGIVVYGAAAIALFLNMKPYWLTLDIIKGKNYSKIKHERNMSNIQLISISSDQCQVLRKYFVYYQKQQSLPSTMKLGPFIKLRMKFAGISYWFVSKRADLRVWRNQEIDVLTGEKYFKQEMAAIYFDKKTNTYMVDFTGKKRNCKYVKVNDAILAEKNFKTKLEKALGFQVSQKVIDDINKVNAKLKEKPFSDHEIKLTAKLAYLQNVRTGLLFRNTISKQNKLTYFTLEQTKKQAEEIGLAEIRSKKQYDFAHAAYRRAYYKTYLVVKAHYDAMVKTFTRDKQLNVMGVRFNPATLEQLFMTNLKKEIAAISHLINCPLNKSQLLEVGSLVSKTQYLQSRIDAQTDEAANYRKMAMPFFDKSRKLNDKAKRYHAQLKANAKLLAKLVESPVNDIELNEVNELMKRVEDLNINMTNAKNEASNSKDIADNYVTRSKDITEQIAVDTASRDQANRKIAAIVEKARATEKIVQNDKWTAQKMANDAAERELRKIEIRQARRAARRGE